MKYTKTAKQEMTNGQLVKMPVVIVFLSAILLLTQSEQVFGLSGLIDSTIRDMEAAGDTRDNSSSNTNSSNCTGCSSSCTRNCSASGSLTDRINSTIQDMEETRPASTNTGTTNTGTNSGSSYNTPLNAPSCPFSAGSGRYVVDLDEDIRADSSSSRSRFTVNSDIPSGRYNIRVFTWDDHSETPAQSQSNEQAVLALLNSSGSTIYTTSRTEDIPSNTNSITSTVASNVNISQSVDEILVFHPEYPSSNPESLVPICAEFSLISDPVDPDDLEVECRVSDASIEEGDTVEFEAIVSGGDSPYDYDWDGDVSSSQQQFEIRFNDEGNYDIDVTVTDEDGNTASDACPVIVVSAEDDDDDDDDDDDNNDDFEIQCELSDSTIDEGDYVTIEVEIDGGDSPFDIEWDRDADEISGFDLDDNSQRIRVRDAGTYDLRVTVEDDNGERDSDTCTLRVGDEDDDDRNVNVYGGGLDRTDGDLAGLSSVYLNQVPYTGPEDNLKIFGFIALILIWSSTISYYVMKGREKRKVSNRIEAFKQANKETLIA